MARCAQSGASMIPYRAGRRGALITQKAGLEFNHQKQQREAQSGLHNSLEEANATRQEPYPFRMPIGNMGCQKKQSNPQAPCPQRSTALRDEPASRQPSLPVTPGEANQVNDGPDAWRHKHQHNQLLAQGGNISEVIATRHDRTVGKHRLKIQFAQRHIKYNQCNGQPGPGTLNPPRCCRQERGRYQESRRRLLKKALL